MITQKELKEKYTYDKSTGLFTRNKSGYGCLAGQIAGTVMNKGYISININKKPTLAHRLAWLYVTGSFPKGQIDHKDKDRTNNKFTNLREVSNITNNRNKCRLKRNKSGVNGVTILPNGKFRAMIFVSGRNIHLGVFKTLAEAELCRIHADRIYGFSSHHGKG